MSKIAHDDVLDGALNIIKNNATRLCICSTQPTTYEEAITTYKLGIVTIDSNDFTGPSDGTSGRKVVVAGQSGVNVDADDNAQHIALCDSVNSKLLWVTTCTPQLLSSGSSVNTSEWTITFGDPS